ncbi:MAG: hypothetical protein M3161_05105 [Actinomycetota bacterium]|nr:hypothetical protein [Actinomycetota bacterium]
MNDKLLGIYLNDHRAGAEAGGELARRALANNRGTSYAPFLEELARGIEEDTAALEALMETLGIAQDPIKKKVAWVAEKVGRLKLNGQITGYSPLSRVLELEGLKLGVTGKLSLWQAMKELADHDPRLAVQDFDELIRRAESQIEGLEQHRVTAAAEALT